jgi:hypothetical protein
MHVEELAAIVQPLFLNEDSGHPKRNVGARVFRRAGQPGPENFDVGRYFLLFVSGGAAAGQ